MQLHTSRNTVVKHTVQTHTQVTPNKVQYFCHLNIIKGDKVLTESRSLIQHIHSLTYSKKTKRLHEYRPHHLKKKCQYQLKFFRQICVMGSEYLIWLP